MYLPEATAASAAARPSASALAAAGSMLPRVSLNGHLAV